MNAYVPNRSLKQLCQYLQLNHYWSTTQKADENWFATYVPKHLCLSWSLRQPDCTFIHLSRQAKANAKQLKHLAKAQIALLISDDASVQSDVPTLIVPDIERQLTRLLMAYFELPSIRATMIAVTGTNGKSSCTHLLAQLLHAQGHRVGVLGTLGNGVWNPPQDLAPSPLTTLGVVELYQQLAHLHQQQVDFIIMEVSSHAIHQQRILDLKFDLAIFSNLSHDHLDYHHGMEKYFQVKKRLFTQHLKIGAWAIINQQDTYGRRLLNELQQSQKQQQLAVNQHTRLGKAQLTSIHLQQQGTQLQWQIQQRFLSVNLPLYGGFQVDNLLLVLASLHCLGLSIETLLPKLARLHSITGRMQPFCIAGEPYPRVFVDYAHTPEALASALHSLRLHAGSKATLLCLFGCGGNRDQRKRAKMGEVAVAGADSLIISDDNPRDENAATIRKCILLGVMSQQQKQSRSVSVTEIANRSIAIDTAMQTLQQQQHMYLLIAGKGHEQGQIIGRETLPFSDINEVQKHLQSND